MARYSVRLKRTADSFFCGYEIEAADQSSAEAAADNLAAAGGGGFDTPEVALVGSGEGLTQVVADLLYAGIAHNHAGIYEPANANIQAHVAQAHLTLAEVYPVGCIYTTTVSTNPATVFGFGTWSAFGAGRVLVGFDSGDTDFDAAEETGGAKTVASSGSVSAPTITVNALAGGTRKGGTSNPGSIIENGNVPTATASAPTFTGNATSVVQPYIVVYFFKRTA